MLEAFTAVVEESFDPAVEEDRVRLGAACTDLLADRDLMLVMLHGFAAGDNAEIGARGREVMAQIAGLLRATGMSADEVRDFIAQGMLLTVLMAMRGPGHATESAALRELVDCAFGDAVEMVCE